MLYIPLRQKITIARSRTEYLFGSHGADRSLAESQRLDALIYRVLLIRRGRFCCNPKKIAARRKARRSRYDASAAS
ncbi:MAG: hypothetical protein FWE77_04470 [Clostridia bacterium]|nr:hypothetical protein [Clostridia bacterium]